jgi:hypothetical protein
VSRPRTAACVVVKNEARDIAEWVAYHRLIGFDELIVYDNSSTDGTLAALRTAARRVPIHIFDWPRSDPAMQTEAYEDACRRFAGTFDWIACVDADEFLVLRQHGSINEWLSGFDGFAAVGVSWAIFGASGHEDIPPGLVIESFTHRSTPDFAPNRHVKSVVRPDKVIACANAHFFRMDGAYCDASGNPIAWQHMVGNEQLPGGVSDRAPDWSVAQLNHYFVRSREQWRQKLSRGYYQGGPQRRMEEFEFYNRNEMEDLAAAKHAGGVRELIAGFPAEPGLNPVVHVLTQGNMANQMIQYLVAARLASLVPGCAVSHVDLPDWGIRHPLIPETGGPKLLVEGQQVDLQGIASRMREGAVERVELLAYGQWMTNFPSRADCQRIFPPDPAYPGFGPDKLVCNIRGGEVLDARHPDYTLLPVGFYGELIARTGLSPVFMGQIEDNCYCRELAQAFPKAEFQPSRGAYADFQSFRNSANLVVGVSTFSWLAAWLSEASRVALPVSGLFHPVQSPDVHLLPLNDPRYSFHLFPINYAVPVSEHRSAHAPLQGLWRQMRPEAIGALRAGPRWPRRVEAAGPLLDERFYLATYPDVASVVSEGSMTALQHYYQHGHAEGRRAFPFDKAWYSRAYPIAAFEVGQGDYADLEHHYVEIGRARGYRPVPPKDANAASTNPMLATGGPASDRNQVRDGQTR